MMAKETPEDENLYWQAYRRKEEASPLQAHRGSDIEAGDRFIAFYRTEETEKGIEVRESLYIRRDEVSFCELCGVPLLVKHTT